MLTRIIAVVLSVLVAVPELVRACSICSPNFQQRQTWREHARSAKFVVRGVLQNARVVGANGATDFNIEEIIQPDPRLANQKVLTIPQYIPFNAQETPRYVLFGDFINGKLDVISAHRVQGANAAVYLKAALQIHDRDRAAVLQYCYKHLDSTDVAVADDAFHEFAKANDQEIAQVAHKLSPEKLRKMIQDPKTSADRLGIYAYLLGVCGTKDDAESLLGMIGKKDDRANFALSGLLGGLIELRRDAGWATLRQILADPQRPFADKLSAHGTLRFHHSVKPNDSRKEILQCLNSVLDQGDMADMAVEDLRRWHWWDLSKQIVAKYPKPTHAAPIIRRAIIRYALCCPDAESAQFIKAMRENRGDLVAQVEESLKFELPDQPKKNP